METKLVYGLRNRTTGKLVHIASRDNGEDRYACGPESFWLTNAEFCPVFTVEEVAKLVPVLASDTFWANTAEDCPGWGSFTPDELEPVAIETTITITPVELDLPVMFAPVETRAVPYLVASKRVAQTLDPDADYVFVVTPLPENLSRADVEALMGRPAFFGDVWTRRTIRGCGDVPEEYVDLLRGKEGVALICERE